MFDWVQNRKSMALDPNTFTRTSLSIAWSTMWDHDGYYVIEQIGDGGHKAKWGPMPTKTIAVALIEERKAWAEGEVQRLAAEFGGRKGDEASPIKGREIRA
jgi:hypothetical protein